jgi:hypothetical protein
MKRLLRRFLVLPALWMPFYSASVADQFAAVQSNFAPPLLSEITVDPFENIRLPEHSPLGADSGVSTEMMDLYLGTNEAYSDSNAPIVGGIIDLEVYEVRPVRDFALEKIETQLERRPPTFKEKKSLWEGSIGRKIGFQVFPESNPLVFLRLRW